MKTDDGWGVFIFSIVIGFIVLSCVVSDQQKRIKALEKRMEARP